VSRQIAGLERVAGTVLFERRPNGVRQTPAGLTMLRHARVALDALAAAERELTGADSAAQEVRLGAYVSAGAALVPRVVSGMRGSHPHIRVTTREGTTPSLVRAIRAGSLDLAVITARPPYRPPDSELPRLQLSTLGEGALLVAAAEHGAFAGRSSVGVDELGDVDWIASASTGAEPLLGVWPGLAGRPRIVHSARDWLTKLQLVAAGCGLTTVPVAMAEALPGGVRLLRVEGGPPERRRIMAARLPGKARPEVAEVAEALARFAAG